MAYHARVGFDLLRDFVLIGRLSRFAFFSEKNTMNDLQKKYEDWQVAQAEEAIRLYGYCQSRKRHQEPTGTVMDTNALWRKYAGQMKTVLRA